MFQIDASLFGKKSLFKCKSPLLLLFHYFYCAPSLTHYTQFRQPWSDLTCDIAAAFPPVNLFNCITDFVFARFVVGIFFPFFGDLKHIESS